MDWRLLEATREAAPRVAASEVRPSIRDFAQYLGAGRQALSVIPLLAWRGGASDSIDDVGTLAAALDALEIPALAVATAPGAGRLAELTAVAAAVSAPVLRYDCVGGEDRLYESRLAGADAVLVPVGPAGTELTRLIALARAVHVICVAEVTSAAECERALAAGAPVIALAAGKLALAAQIPTRRPLIAQEPIDTPADLAQLCGVVDAVLVATPVEGDPLARIRCLIDAAATLVP
jgi:indole-3-glycerol phosphate synthase